MSRPKKKNFDDINLNKEIPIIKREEKRRLIFGVVYEPNVVDAHGDNTTPDELQKAAHKFLERHNSINFMHETKINQHAKVVESFIAPITYRENGQTIKKWSSPRSSEGPRELAKHQWVAGSDNPPVTRIALNRPRGDHPHDVLAYLLEISPTALPLLGRQLQTK